MPNADRIQILQAELSALKKERKEQAIALKMSRKWVSVKKRLPERGPMRGSIQVLAWANDKLELCWFDDEKITWARYNGTWCVWPKDHIEGVTHWMGSNWGVKDFYCPPCGPGIVNRILYLWRRFTQGVSDTAHDMRPKSWSRGNVQLDKKPVFYKDSRGKIVTGLPEDRPAPRGYQKIVCNNVFEAERYSELQRQQERSEHGMIMEKREQIEGAVQSEWRKNAQNLMMNARNQVNREFMEAALKRNAEHKPWKYERISFLHSEGFEEKD